VSPSSLVFGDDPRQAHRISRYLMAVGSSLLALLLMYVLYRRGAMEAAGFRQAGLAMLFFFLMFYGLLRAGINLRFADPSLTVWQMMASLVVLLAAMFHAASDVRPVFHLMFLMTFLFGIFRLDTFMMLTMGLFATVGYGLVIILLMQWRPQALELELEMLRWTVLTAMLVWFSLMGGYISRIRKELSVSRKELEKALLAIRGMTVQDELTGVPNRRFLMNALRQHQALSIRTGEPFCVALADIDFFKNINDTLGHSAGDTVLCEFSASVMRSLRASDQFGRWGGEEFMLLMPRTSMQEAITGAERLRQNTEALSFPVGDNLILTVSMGLAQYRIGEDIEDTLRRADVALYRAKAAGRNRVEFELGEANSVSAAGAG